jgi:hypothetical protein
VGLVAAYEGSFRNTVATGSVLTVKLMSTSGFVLSVSSDACAKKKNHFSLSRSFVIVF